MNYCALLALGAILLAAPRAAEAQTTCAGESVPAPAQGIDAHVACSVAPKPCEAVYAVSESSNQLPGPDGDVM